jgi:O-antigen/teichoic acid export membrane protein
MAESDEQPFSSVSEPPPFPDNVRSYRESAVYLAAKVFPFVFNLLFIRFYTTRFAPETVGRYETALALGIVAAAFGAGWIQMAVLRLYPKWRDSGSLPLLISAAHVAFLLSLLVGGSVFCSAWLARSTAMGAKFSFDLMGWALVLFIGNACFLYLTTYLRAQRRAGLFSMCSGLASPLNLGVAFILTATLGPNVASLAFGAAVSFLLPALLALYLAYPKLGEKPGGAGESAKPGLPQAFGALALFGLPLALNQACAQLLNLSDRYAILILRGAEEAGIYSASYRLADLAVRFILLSLMMSAYTAVSEAYDTKGRKAAEHLVASLSRFYLLVAAPAAVGIGLVQQDAMKILAGPEFLAGAPLLLWISLGNLLLGLSQYQHFGLHLGGRTLRLALMTLSAAVLNIVLNLIFVPRYGYPAAAYTTFASFLYLSAVAPILGRPWLEWRVSVSSIGRIGVALVIMGGAVWLARVFFEAPLFRLLASIAVGAMAYGAALFAVGEIRPSDLKRLLSRNV